MAEYGTFTEPGTIVFRRLLPGSLERVWAYLTESDKRRQWLAAGEMELEVGGRVALHFFHTDLTPHSEAVPARHAELAEGATLSGRITRIEPPHLLAYTWGEDQGYASEVTFELTPKGDEVLLVLTHRRLRDTREAHISVAAGWHTHLGILADRLAGNAPQPFWTAHAAREAEYAQRIPESLR